LTNATNVSVDRNSITFSGHFGIQADACSAVHIGSNVVSDNADHGFDHTGATGSIHIGDVAYHNFKDGFSFEGNAPGSQVFDCIAVENGLTTGEYDLWVDGTSTSGFQSNDNIFWNSTAQPPVKYITTTYTSVADYSAASGQDTRTKQADPRFADPTHADFHLLAASPAIDDANSGVAHW